MAEKFFKKTTPYIRPITKSGGTFYTFSSASEDFGLSFSDNNSRKFKFSKFALLKLPEFTNNNNRYKENLIRLKAIPGEFSRIEQRGLSNVNMNNYFAESLQNYMLNFETLVISDENYDFTEPHTVTEYVFWKWLKELGAIRFTKSNNSYTEENDGPNYERVVKYIGDIDVVNNYFGKEESYFEVYFRVPVDAGKFKNIYFNSIEENNYKSNKIFSTNINPDYISGRSNTDSHPIPNFDIKAYYDNPFGDKNNTYNIYLKKLNNKNNYFDSLSDFSDEWWYKESLPKSYITSYTYDYKSDINDILAIGSDNSNIDNYTIFTRSRLDGINLNFNINDYLPEYGNANYYTFTDIATSPYASDFEFNAVLIYYDILEKDENTSDNITSDDITIDYVETKYVIKATNLFGIYFLDNVVPTSTVPLDGAKIPCLQKCVPNKITQNSGNAYNGIIKFKIDSSPIDVFANKITEISNGNTLSMEIFLDALNTMRGISNDLLANLSYMTNSVNTLNNISKSEIFKNPSLIPTILNRIEQLEKFQMEFNNLFNTSKIEEISKLVKDNNDFMQDIKDGNLESLKSQQIFFKEGNGIFINKSKSYSEFSIKNTLNVDNNSIISFNDFKTDPADTSYYFYEVYLKPMNNYIRFINNNNIFNKNLELRINDLYYKWQKGQIFRITFQGDFNLQNKYSFIIKTNYINNTYNKIITITPSEFNINGKNPIYELICLDDIKYNFIYDTLK